MTSPLDEGPHDEFFDLLEHARPSWHHRAACRGLTKIMYDDTKAGVERAKAVCGRCGVRGDCLKAALERGERWGVWGGLDPRERRRLAKARAA